MQADTLIIPPHLRTRNLVYRSLGPTGKEHMIGCGSIPKPSLAGLTTRFCQDTYSAVYLLAGSGTYQDQTGFTCTLQAGDLLHRFPRRAHESVPTPDGLWLEVFVLLPGEVYDLLHKAGMFADARPVWKPGLSQHLLDRFVELHRELSGNPGPNHAASLIAMQRFILEAARLSSRVAPPAQGDAWVPQACKLLTEPPWAPTPAIAAQLGLEYETFRKLFRRHVGTAPGTFRNRYRIDRSRELLAGRSQTISQIAQELGYADVFCFSKQFKSAVGLSPRHYRRRHH